MKVYRNIIVLFLFNFLIFNQLLSQNSEVILYSGRVVNEKNQPLNYAHVLIVNQFIGTITNETGNFFLPVNAKDTLIFRYLGYINDTIIIPDTLQSPFFFQHHQVTARIADVERGYYPSLPQRCR